MASPPNVPQETVPPPPKLLQRMLTRRESAASETKGLLCMIFLALQYGLQPMLQRKFTSNGATITSIVLSCELCKAVLAVALVYYQGLFKTLRRGWTLSGALLFSMLPASIYSVQNILLQISHRHLDYVTFSMLNHSKLLFTALFMYLLLRHKQSTMQWVALLFVIVAACLVAVGEAPLKSKSARLDTTSWSSVSFYWGVIPVLAASVLSGLASTLCQKAVQADGRSTYLMTIEMSTFAVLLLLASLLWSKDGKQTLEHGLFAHWDVWTAVPVLSNAGGGILVGLVTKHVGGVKKGFVLIFALFVTALAQYIFEGIPLSTYSMLAFPLVVLGTLLHAQYPYVAKLKEY